MKHVYIVRSLSEDTTLVFGSRKRAEKSIKNEGILTFFSKSQKEDIYITRRLLF